MALHLVFPAAGVGKRLGADVPKQFIEIVGRTVFEWTLEAWKEFPVDGRKIIVCKKTDFMSSISSQYFDEVSYVPGGVDRAHSVFNALGYLLKTESASDWVLVHDIARPCVRMKDVARLVSQCRSSNVGGVLARPITDTIKLRKDDHLNTVDRSSLWAAQTPQMFQLGPLSDALEKCFENNIEVTDESSAMEYIGQPVNLVEGSADNIKLTHSVDVSLVEFYLKQQGR